MHYFALPIVELPEARTSKIATRRDLTRPRSEADRGSIFPHAGAAEDCLQEECSVDTVQMLVGQLKNREQELAKKGRIVGARCPRSDFYASCTPIAAASSLRRRQRRWRWIDTRAG